MPQCASCGSAVAENSRICDRCGSSPLPDSFATQTVAIDTPRSPSTHAVSARHSARTQGRFAPGETLGGRYRIIAMLGKGGMGEVYRADDLVLDQPVALKFLPEAVARNPQAVDRFRNEVRIARQVSHPNVCRVYDLGEIEGLYFLSMEYVDGEDLGSLLRRIGRLPTEKALDIARKLCAGLAAAHEKGVLHRDLKPANVMLDARGHVLLTDFGLAGLAEEIEGAEVRNGTPAYMAPEQLAGREVTIRSDIYALGLVLYEIFTGKLPFESATLAELMRAQQESAPASITTIVRDLDPMVERVILRCLSPKPPLRPASALAVAAALPGGDPLAAALAAGETPSPEMVAAAGEGEGLSPRIAVALLLFLLIATPAIYVVRSRASALNMLAPEYGPEVMTLKAREIAQKLGVPKRSYDDWYRYDWNAGLLDYLQKSRPGARWPQVLAAHPEALRFEYRSHVAPLTAVMIHDDLMTPGVVYWEDPPFEESGMVRIALDAQGHLVQFERMPLQRDTAPHAAASQPDWPALFSAAGLDLAKFTPAQPEWNSLSAADTRAAWTAQEPMPLRVEAASLSGQPVFFSIIYPWTKPDRVPEANPSSSNSIVFGILSTVMVVTCFASALLAASNLRRNRGDRRGAFRVAAFVSIVQMALWLSRGHILMSFGTFGTFVVAMCTSIFYGVVIWTVYLALEPYVRRWWPQTLISWSAVLVGKPRDAVVGRDILIGCVAAAVQAVVNRSADTYFRRIGDWTPDLDVTIPLAGLRGAFAGLFFALPHAIRDSLFFFLILFLFRALFRKEWIAGIAFAALFAALNLADATHPWFNAGLSFVVLLGFATVFLRWGLLAGATMLLFGNFFGIPPASPSAWYFTQSMFLLAIALAIVLWAFHTSLGGRKLWKEDFFG